MCFLHLPSSLFFFSLFQFLLSPAFPLFMFTYLRLGLFCCSCQATGSCYTKSALPESIAPLSDSQEVQIQWGKLSIQAKQQSSREASTSSIQVGSSFYCSAQSYCRILWVQNFLFAFFPSLTPILPIVLAELQPASSLSLAIACIFWYTIYLYAI